MFWSPHKEEYLKCALFLRELCRDEKNVNVEAETEGGAVSLPHYRSILYMCQIPGEKASLDIFYFDFDLFVHSVTS